jgi:primosomal protein N' (replication factor Y)
MGMNVSPKVFVDVVLPVSLPNLYTYHIEGEDNIRSISPGIRVSVQFGKRKLFTALVVKVHNSPPADYKTKPILALLDNTPVVKEWQIGFWKWLSEYYMCTIGDVFVAALPNGLRPEGQTSIYLEELPSEGIKLSASEEGIWNILNHNPGISIEKLNPLVENKQVMPLLKRLMDKRLISFEESLKEKHKPNKVEYLKLHPELQIEAALSEILNRLERRAPKQSNTLMTYLQLSGYVNKGTYDAVSKHDLMKAADVNASVIKSLLDKHIFEVEFIEVTHFNDLEKPLQNFANLSEKQQHALDEIKTSFETHAVSLLHGVTSSGKTEIYIHLIEEALEKGQQVLYLLPEIALTTQIITRLHKVFGRKVGVYHSKYSDGERIEVWNNLLGQLPDGATKYNIILGVRSSVLLPFNNLGLIIVDEEHENTYKQFDPAPRYHARDAAIVLANIHKAKVLLGSATPSLESYFNAKLGKYGFIALYDRHLDIKLPEIEVVNTREARRKRQMSGLFSAPLVNEIQKALHNNEQVILFQNRRGFSPYLECADCAWIPQCQYCDVSLTYHKSLHKLTCHYCGYSIPAVVQCKACGSNNMQTRGFGTEKIEDDLALLLPKAKLLRMDMDTTRKKNAYEKIINKFASGDIDILIGTQMVSKGLDFDNVSIVGIMNADSMLNFPDFRAYERSFQLMSQVSGRAGRKKKQGKVIIQTNSPGNSIVQQVVENNFEDFFKEQMAERKLFRYPPYFRLISITLRHKQRDQLFRASRLLADDLRKLFGKRVLGPEAPLVGKIQNWHLQHILIKLEKTSEIPSQKSAILEACNTIKQQNGLSTLQIILDVDPF